MTGSRLRIGALTCVAFLAFSCAPSALLAAPPQSASTRGELPPKIPKRAKRELVAGGILVGLGLAAELSGSVVSIGCTSMDWCARGFVVSLGPPQGPNRYTMASAGPSSAYLMGRIVATPLLISGFTLTTVGIATVPERMASWTDRRTRRIGWSLLGSGLGVLVGATTLRVVFLSTGICQDPLCVHGVDQASLWVGRGLTFAGAGVLVRGAAGGRVELGVSGGPSSSYGLSIDGRF